MGIYRHKLDIELITKQKIHARLNLSFTLLLLGPHKRAPGRVHYSDTVLYLGGQPGKTSLSRHNSGISSRDRGHSIQTNLPNGISSFSSNDFKYTHQPTATSSLNHGSHRLSSTVRRDDVVDGRNFPQGQEVVDDGDVLMVDDLDTSLQSLSDDLLVGGASYGDLHLKEDGELSDISELLVMPPQPRPATSVSGELIFNFSDYLVRL